MNELERQKLEALKELAYGASHEINNPLANIAARAQTLLRDEPHPERRRALEAIYQQAMRAHEMISDLMLFARPPRLEPERVCLQKFLRAQIAEVETEALAADIRFAFSAPNEDITTAFDPQQMAMAIRALFANAVEAIGRSGKIAVAVERGGEDGGSEQVRISVKDDGPGVSESVRQHMFDPFFSGREAGRGLGFGLSKCWRIVTDHGGDLTVCSEPGHGTEIIVILPT